MIIKKFNDKRLKICINASVGLEAGPSLYFRDLAKILKNIGHEVFIFTDIIKPKNAFDENDIVVYRKKWIPGIQLNVVLNIVKNRYDVFIRMFHVYPTVLDTFLRIFSGILGMKYIYVISGSDWFDSIRPKLLKKSLFHRIFASIVDMYWMIVLRGSSKIIADKDTINRLLNEYGLPRDKMVEITTHVDVKIFNPNVKPFKLDGKRIILYIGRLSDEKGIVYLIRAMSKIISSYKDVNLVLVGEGEIRRNLEELSRNLGIDRFIRFLGRVPHDKVPKYIASADIVVNPIVWGAGLGNVTVEVMSMGKPLIMGKANSTINELGREGYVVTVNPKDVNEIAEEVLYMLLNPKKRKKIAKRALRYAINNFTINSQEKVWQKIIESVMKNR